MDIGGPTSATCVRNPSPPGPPSSSQISSGYDRQSHSGHILITFKFGGNFVKVKNQERRKYEGCKQRSLRIEKEHICLILLKERVEMICPWIRGHKYELYYHIFGTNPKDYELLISDVEVLEMINHPNRGYRVEIIVVLQDGIEDSISQSSLSLITPNNIDDTTISVGTCFIDSKSFKLALQTVAINNNFGLKIRASDRKRVIATCSHHSCTWRIRASVCADAMTFQVRKLEGAHTCPGVNRAGNRLATSAWVANEIQEIVKKNPDIPPKQISNSLELSYGLSLSYTKLWRGREQAKEIIFGNVDDSYKWIPTLRCELINRNPGSHITYSTDGDGCSFQRFFVSFKVCIDGFLVGCRHLIGLDACHLKSKYLGVLLSATTLDGDNGLYTLAYAVVETESKKTWQWFLENFSVALNYELDSLAFISDMEKGLLEAIRHVFPDAEHRVCVRHLWKNLRKYFRFQEGHMIQSLVWTAANTYTKLEFDQKLAEILNVNSTLHAYLISLPYKWSRSQFCITIKNDANTNNMAESFNSWINTARSKPAVELVDIIRGMIMEQRATRKMRSLSWIGEMVPHAKDYLREVTTRKEQLVVRPSAPYKAEVEGRFKRHEVDIDLKECTCRFWQMTGLPCIHAVAFIGMKEHPLWHIYVDDQFSVTRYRMAYDGAIATLPDKEQWHFVDDGVMIGPPNTSRPRGRPKKRRLKSFLEKDKKDHKCSRCLQYGHHKSTCKNPLSQARSTTNIANNASTSRIKLPIRREPTTEFTSDDEITCELADF